MAIVTTNFPFEMNSLMGSLSWFQEISSQIRFVDYKFTHRERKPGHKLSDGS